MQNRPNSPQNLEDVDLEAPDHQNLANDGGNAGNQETNQRPAMHLQILRFNLFGEADRNYMNRRIDYALERSSNKNNNINVTAIIGSMLYVTGVVNNNLGMQWLGLSFALMAAFYNLGQGIMQQCKGEPEPPSEPLLPQFRPR